ncbi:uncharacterized protein DS421_8g252610 [Arachis hypogaea]|nr:uncharacterized protein DS421_8g252610 [Arachis hypogaea]
MMSIGVGNEQDHLMFGRIFILYIQMAFLLPTTINKISPVHLAPIFKMDKIKEANWGAHVLNFIIKGITNYNLKKKKSIDGCLFALMIVYFHLSTKKEKKGEERAAQPWIANWNREQLVERMRAEIDEHILRLKKTQRNQQGNNPPEQQKRDNPKRKRSLLRIHLMNKLNLIMGVFFANNCFWFAKEKEADLRSTEGHYVSFETILEVNLGSDDPLSQGHTDQSSINKLAESMVYFREETHDDCAGRDTVTNRSAFNTTPMPQIEQTPVTENEPTPMPENKPTPVPEIEPTPAKSPIEKNNEGTTKCTPEPPPKPEESTPTLPPAPSKINSAPEDAAALMMMARTASYIPKEGSMPSFSLGLTDSSQEEAATQEGTATQDREGENS